MLLLKELVIGAAETLDTDAPPKNISRLEDINSVARIATAIFILFFGFVFSIFFTQ